VHEPIRSLVDLKSFSFDFSINLPILEAKFNDFLLRVLFLCPDSEQRTLKMQSNEDNPYILKIRD